MTTSKPWEEPWQPAALANLFETTLFTPLNEEHGEDVEDRELDDVVALDTHNGNIQLPPWPENRMMSSFDESVEPKLAGGWSLAMIATRFGDLGSQTDKFRSVRLQLRSDVLLPSVRVKLGQSESPEGALVFEFDPDVVGITCQNVSMESPEAHDVLKRMAVTERLKTTKLFKISIRPSSEFGYWLTKNSKPVNHFNIHCKGQEIQIPVTEKSTLYHSRSPRLGLLRSELRTTGVDVWVVNPKNLDAWSRLMTARTLSPGKPDSMWVYTQLPLASFPICFTANGQF